MSDSCQSCRFWNDHIALSGRGQCRRHSAELAIDSFGTPTSRWPVTDQRDWCGDYEEKPMPALQACPTCGKPPKVTGPWLPGDIWDVQCLDCKLGFTGCVGKHEAAGMWNCIRTTDEPSPP